MATKAPRALTRISPGQASVSLDDPISIDSDRSIRVDLSRLPAPTNVYDADAAWVEFARGSASLFFAKQNRDEPTKLRSRLEIRYPVEAMARHFFQNSRQFHVKLREFAATWPTTGVNDRIDAAKLPAEKQHSEWANFESVAHAGSEAGIDFYRLPPSGIAQFAKGQGTSGLRCTSVARVQLTAFELLGLLDQVETLMIDIRGKLPPDVVKALEERVVEAQP